MTRTGYMLNAMQMLSLCLFETLAIEGLCK